MPAGPQVPCDRHRVQHHTSARPAPCRIKPGSTNRSSSSMTYTAGSEWLKQATRPPAVATRVRRSSPPRPANSSASGLASRVMRSPSLDSGTRGGKHPAAQPGRRARRPGSRTSRVRPRARTGSRPSTPRPARPAPAPQPDLQHVGQDPAGSPGARSSSPAAGTRVKTKQARQRPHSVAACRMYARVPAQHMQRSAAHTHSLPPWALTNPAAAGLASTRIATP